MLLCQATPDVTPLLPGKGCMGYKVRLLRSKVKGNAIFSQRLFRKKIDIDPSRQEVDES